MQINCAAYKVPPEDFPTSVNAIRGAEECISGKSDSDAAASSLLPKVEKWRKDATSTIQT